MNHNTHVYEYQHLRATKPCMVYDGAESLADWQKKAREKLSDLLGLPSEIVNEDLHIEYTVPFPDYTETKFYFQSEPGYYVPCYLLVPAKTAKPAPLTLCLSGHGGGMHLAVGHIRCDKDKESLESWPHRAMGLRAIRDGRCALTVEHRSFGESSLEGYGTSCTEASKIALLTGRTALGGCVWDAMRALDVVQKHFHDVDMNDIVCTGSSGGGTETYYLACLDERIKIAAPSSSICTFEDSIAAMPHCMCNFVPGIRKYWEMGDMAAMIAPRHLIVASGMQDSIFPIFGVKRAFEQIQNAYALADAPDNCSLVVGELGHLNYADLIWKEVDRIKGNS